MIVERHHLGQFGPGRGRLLADLVGDAAPQVVGCVHPGEREHRRHFTVGLHFGRRPRVDLEVVVDATALVVVDRIERIGAEQFVEFVGVAGGTGHVVHRPPISISTHGHTGLHELAPETLQT